MKVLHINSYGMFNSLFNNLYREEKKAGIELSVYSFAAYGTQNAALAVPDDLKDQVIYDFNHKNYLRYVFSWKHKTVYRVMKRTIPNLWDFSVTHAHSLFSNGYLSWRLRREFGIPYVVAVRNTDVNVFFRYMLPLRRLGVRMMRNADRIIFLSPAYRDRVLDQYVPAKYREECRTKAEVIPNGIDPFWLHGTCPSKTPPQGTVHIVCAGSIDSNKNQAVTIDACKMLRERGFDVQLTLVGKIGNQQYFNSLEKAPFVTYLPPKSKEELAELYRKQDIFLMPSVHETFGLVYAEAMSQGLPVIYTRGQGFDGQFEEGIIGFSVDCRNAYEVAEKILFILENYEGNSANCIKHCQRFDWTNIADEYTYLYDEVVCGKTEDKRD